MKRSEAVKMMKKTVIAPGLCGLLLGVGLAFASDSPQADDHILKVKSDSTLEELLVRVLHSSKFVEQIASYNQLTDGRASVLETGSSIRIPKPYIQQMHAAEAKGRHFHNRSRWFCEL